MSARVPYDDFAEIYDVWCGSAPITRENQGFYVRRLVAADGPAVELGVSEAHEVRWEGEPTKSWGDGR